MKHTAELAVAIVELTRQLRNAEHLLNLSEVSEEIVRKLAEVRTVGGVLPLVEVEKHAILHAYAVFKGDALATAKHLDIGKTTLYRKLQSYGVVVPHRRPTKAEMEMRANA
jgi:transcriptional regulator of acetoin/glycerol metabolism